MRLLKLWKSCIGVIVSIILVVALLCGTDVKKMVSVKAASGYNVDLAIAYAEAHWNDNNGLCAEFVAKCVQAGGINIPTYTLTNLVYDAIINETGVSGQWLTLTSGGYALYSQNSNKLSKGDVVISWCGDYGHTYRPHIMLCGGYDSSGYATFYAHNNARHNERIPASSGRCEVCGRKNGQIKAQVLHISSLNSVGEIVNLGDDFCAYIINTGHWKHLTADANNNVTMRSETGASNQIWHFYRQGDGSYEIVNCASGKALDDIDFGQTNGTNVQVYDRNNMSAQKWFIRGEQGKYFLNSGCGSAVLDVADNSSADGTNIQMWERNNTGAQKFSVWKLDAPASSVLMVKSGTSTTQTTFAWTKSDNALWYNVRIFKDTLYTGKDYSKWEIRNQSLSMTLPEGNYIAYIDSCNNTDKYTASNHVSFTVKKGISLGKCNMTGLKNIQNGKKLLWNTVSGATQYEIYRKKSTDSRYSRIGMAWGGSINSYSDKSCVSGTTYLYKVKASNSSSTGEYGKGYYSLYLDSPDIWLEAVSTDNIKLSWNEVIGAEGYYIYVCNADNTYTRVKEISDGTATSCTISDLSQGTTYQYIIRAYGTCTYNNKSSINTSYRSNILTVTTSEYNGLVKENGAYYYYRNGIKQTGYTGLVKHTDDTWCYVIKGKWQPDYTGIIRNTNGKYYYIYKGRRNYSSKLVKYTDGSWLYVKNGEWQPQYTGIIKNSNGKYYYIYKGRRNYSSKLVKHTNGKWWYVKNGEWQPEYTGIVKQPSGRRYYVVKGKKKYKTGYVTVNGRRYRVVKGEVK